MNGETYSRGVLLWIDDRFADLEKQPEELWEEVFGDVSPRPYRLMDLNLQIAVSFDDALRAVEQLGSAETAGTYVVCVVDLKIPRRRGEDDQTRYGVNIAKEIRRHNLPMFFLSSNADATDILTKHNLETVPYYVKQPQQGPWRLPDDLARMVLSEFRNHVSWITLEDIVGSIHENSKVAATYREHPEAFKNFPFFGPFRDFVWRWESRLQIEFPQIFAVKATVDHCDEFIQQALLVILNQHLTQIAEPTIHYGSGVVRNYLDFLAMDHIREDGNSISVVRAHPEEVSELHLPQLIEQAGRRAGMTIFVLPNDESCDRYADLLHERRVPIIDELPQLRLGDANARSELINKSCALIFQRWSRDADIGGDLSLSMGYLAHPELLINPINWTFLHEAETVARALSDPYEICKELLDAIDNLTAKQRKSIRSAVRQRLPVDYEFLLRVGEATMRGADVRSRRPDWIERALDEWLNTSWHFPYGLSKQFSSYELIETEGRPLDDSAEDREAWRCRHWAAWEDSCYRTLVGMLKEYGKELPEIRTNSAEQGRRAALARTYRFVDSLGGNGFMKEQADVDWEALESLRWPHHRYPMPAAINHRLKRCGRYLWIQPEGLDLASALPTGRTRYRMLGSIVEQYASVLSWGGEIADRLPRGWRESVRYLTDVIRGHRVAFEWEENRQEMWHMLLGLVRNGTPLMFVVSQLLRNKQLRDTKSRLSTTKGYGEILGMVRGTLGERLGTFLISQWNTPGVADNLSALAQAGATAQMAGPRSSELYETLEQMLARIITLDPTSERYSEQLSDLWRAWMSDQTLGLVKDGTGWYTDKLAEKGGDPRLLPFKSLCGVKGDSLWHLLDAMTLFTHVTQRYRYADGYHLLAAINDLRRIGKDTPPDVGLPVIETVLEFFVASLEGLVAQLAWFLEVSERPESAQTIQSKNVRIKAPATFKKPNLEKLEEIMKVHDPGDGYAIYTLGIPGEGHVAKLGCHIGDHVHLLEAERKLAAA